MCPHPKSECSFSLFYIPVQTFLLYICCFTCVNVSPHFVLLKLDRKTQPFPYFQLLLSSPCFMILSSTFSGFWGLTEWLFWGGLITSCVLCIAPPAPPPSGPPSTLTPGGSSTLSKKRPPPPPPGHKRTLSDPPSPLSHSPHSKGGLTGGETQAHVWTVGLVSLRPEARILWLSKIAGLFNKALK